MPESNVSQDPQQSTLSKAIAEMTQPFKDLVHASRALWAINLSYMLEGLTYFGVLTLLAIFFNKQLGLNDIEADHSVGFLTWGITLAMLFLGATVDIIGPRRALLISLACMLVGRVLLTVSPDILPGYGLYSPPHLIALAALAWVILGYGIYQPACYSAVKQFSSPKTSAMGYAMLYALMNLGSFLPGLVSPPVRGLFGIQGVFWVYVAATVAGIGVIAFLLTKKTVEKARAEAVAEGAEEQTVEEKKPLKDQIKFYASNLPRDLRFWFFIVILMPVQTLFAHNWLTLPQYCSRAFVGTVQDNFETFVNLNPLFIFIFTPIITALTIKRNTYTMMIVGTLVMAVPTFLLSLGPSMTTLIAFQVFMTLGEAIWSARFLGWIVEIAPPKMSGIYMGIGQIPWFFTKFVTSLYAGWFLMHYCPDNVPPSQMHTESMWFIYALIAMITPVGLILARKWMMKGFKSRHDEVLAQ